MSGFVTHDFDLGELVNNYADTRAEKLGDVILNIQ